MNSWSNRINQFIQHKLLITFILGLFLVVPMIATAQEVTEEPQVDTVVTEEATVAPTVTTVAPTAEPTEEPDVVPEATEATPEPEATVEETEVFVEATEEVLIETTEEPTVEVVETVEVIDETETPVVVEVVPVEITSISEDFEAWTGDNWTVTDWSVVSVDDSLVLFSDVADAMAQVTSLDWTTYTIEVDVKVEAGNTLTINFGGYALLLASDGRNRLSQGDAIVATSPASDNPDSEISWHHVSIMKSATALAVIVDDIPQYTVESTASPLGIFAFVATGDQGISIDNLLMAEVDEADIEIVEVISTPTPEVEIIATEIIDSPEATEEPDLLAEVTEEPDLLAESTEEPDLLAESTEEPDLLAESTEEPDLLAEVTEEPDLLAEATEEPDLLAEATEEPAVSVVDEPIAPTYVVTNVITEDFEGDLSLWNTTASIVEVADGNHVLLVSTNGQLSPVSSTTASGVVIAGQANIMADVETAGSFTTTLSETYTVEISTTGITISENGEVLAAVESAQALNTWFAFSIEAKPEGISVSINDVVVTEYAGTLTLDGNFGISTNTNIMLEDVTVDSITVAEAIEPLATLTPDILFEGIQDKVRGRAKAMVNAYLEGGDEGIAEFLASTSADQDEAGRILVDIAVAQNYDGNTIAALVTEAGGNVTQTYAKSIEAFVNVDIILAIAGNEGIRSIRNINRAVSTGPVGTDGFGTATWTEGYNLLSIEEWHLAGITGQGVKVGVIDTGFSDADSGSERNGNLSCLASTTPVYTVGGLGSSTHGTEIIEVICDMAPSASVSMFRANSAASVQEAVAAARINNIDVLLITLDLGVNTSAGGGISGSIDANVYGEIEAAKEEGMLIVAAAGNNNKRMLVLQLEPGATQSTITINNMSPGDSVLAGWNDFDGGSPIANIGISVPGESDSSNDPHDAVTVTTNASNDVTLTITPTISATTFLQLQIVPADPNSKVQFDYTSISLGSNSTDISSSTGNLGRPADSDHVISVGAICTRTNDNPTRWEFSSNGPRFKPNGSPLDAGWDDTISQEEAKPSIMSYSFVTTSTKSTAQESDPLDSNGLNPCTLGGLSSGLGGTSAAAAHVAGMTALIMSNDDNTSFEDMNEANATSGDTFETIRDYLQARSVDLPLGANADGFDISYGAGLSILGAPTYDLNDTANPGIAADLLPDSCAGATYYVGQGNLGNTTINGDLVSPFTSIGQALNATAPIPECVIVMPGEYVSPLFVENSYVDPLLVTAYNDVSRIETGDVIFWLRGLYFSPDKDYEYGNSGSEVSYRRRAGLYFGDASSNVEFSGLTFVAARFFTDSGSISNTSAPQAVVMDGSTDTTVSNSQFGKFTLNGVEYPGWNNINATPIQILNEAEGARVENNIFNDNSTDSSNFYPTVAVINSGEFDNPITIIRNEISGNSATNQGTNDWSAILYAEGSHVDIINNAIHDNTGETIVKVKTTNPTALTSITPTHDRRARIVGNVLLNNSTISGQPLKTAGPIINGHFAPMIYIINNTMVSNTVPTGVANFGQLFARGNANSLSNEGSPGNLTVDFAFWEIHNNLIFNNTYRVLVGDTRWGTATGCNRIPNDSDTPLLNAFSWDHTEEFDESQDASGLYVNRGAQNNWIVSNNGTASSEFGACQTAIATSKTNPANVAYDNQNIIDSDNQPVDSRQPLNDDSLLARDGDFQGILTPEELADENFVPTHNKDQWQYYALTDTLIDENNGNLNEFSDGIDAGKELWVSEYTDGAETDIYMDNADIGDDIVGTKRILDVNGWEINWEIDWDPDTPTLSIPQGVSHTDNGDYLVDIGAFEFSPLQFEFNCTEEGCEYYDADQPLTIGSNPPLDPQTFGLLEDSGIVTFDFSGIVTGGFGNLTFSINEHPANYGAQCDDKFENTKGLVNQGVGFNEFFDYCPPQNFYTSTTNSAPEYVSFKITVRDEAGAVATGEVRFTIDPVDDGDLPATAVIGDDAPSGTTFEVVTTLGTSPSVRLRPYTRFGNFFFSENDNPDFESGGELFVDYPFSYLIDEVVEDTPSNPILIGAIQHGIPDMDLGENPIINLELSESDTGSATITYNITDGRGNISTGNKLIIRSVSIIPDEGLHDDTSFIWNFSDAANAAFYTERADHNTTEVPESGDWIAARTLGAINETLHTTSALNDTASFRFIGTGFNVYLRGVAGSAATFDINIYDDDVAQLSTETWSQVSGSTVVNQVTGVGTLECTTNAGIGSDTSLLVQNLAEFTITCNGLAARKHSVQIVNTGAGQLGVDAFSIINDEGSFEDAGPIPPGFHDVDDGVLRNAFNDVNWNEAFDTDYSNGVAYSLVVPEDISFTITRASGFAIGTTYRDNASDFNVCVANETNGNDGVCTTINGDIDQALDGIHFPFFGLNPDFDYTVTLENIDTGFIFDDLVVFSELMLPVANLNLGTTEYTDLDIAFGEPFGDDWNDSGTSQVINSSRSPIGPFISFQIDDNIDTIGINADNATSGLAVCVNRGNTADTDGTNFGNCIIADLTTGMYDNIDSSTGTINSDVGTIHQLDGMIVVVETMFDGVADNEWGNLGDNTVEIFSLYPNDGFQFESVTLFSSASGVGEGSYTANSPGISYVAYDSSTGTYSETSIGDGEFDEIQIIVCTKYKKGKCKSSVNLGSTLRTTGVGNAILFSMQGTGLAPRLNGSSGALARVCIVKDSAITADTTDKAALATEIQLDAQADGGCEIVNLAQSTPNSERYINGINNTTQYVMIELLPSPTSAELYMGFDGLSIRGGDLAGLDTLATGQVYNTSYANRVSDNTFLYTGAWETKEDTNGKYLGTTYDETNAYGSSIVFKTTNVSGSNIVNIIRASESGYSDITVCVAPVDNTADRSCSVHSNSSDATQSNLPISLNTDFDNTTDYVVSITAGTNGFGIDAVAILDTTADKMTVGVYQENSTLISYENGQTEILKNTSFENTPLLGSGAWDWSISGTVASISTVDRYIGLQSLSADGDTDDSVVSEQFEVVAGETYTITARVKVITGAVEMRSDITGFEVQATQHTNNWELVRFSFVASATESVQIEFAAAEDGTSFRLDDVHVYKGGAWSIGNGGLTDGKIATSSGYGSQAKFMFTGTGFTVKLASDTTSGEAQICYDNGVDNHCFTYNDEGPPPSAPVCTGKKKKRVCTTPPPATLNNGHTVVGLASDDYIVTVQQMDNGLNKQLVATSTPTTIKLDYVQIYDNAQPPVLTEGTYNEDAIISSEPAMQLFPADEWDKIIGASGFTNDSYYQVNDSQAAGSLLALKVDNDPDPATIVIDINKANINANQVLACTNDVNGALSFNGTDYDLTSDDCTLTDAATSQAQLVFNQNNLSGLDGSGGDTLFTMQSLTKDSLNIDGFKVLYGSTLPSGYYEETIGASENTGSIIQLSNDADWSSISGNNFSGLSALKTSVSGSSIDFSFNGTGASILLNRTYTSVCTSYKKGKCKSYGSVAAPNGLVSVNVSSTGCGGACTFVTDTTDISASNGAITLAGLPAGIYDVTLTTSIDPGEEVIVDAIEVFGDLQELGSLYDDAQVDVNGTPLLTFGSVWTATTNDTSGAFLNNTKHSSSQFGASVSFVVGSSTATKGIVIFDGNPSVSSSNAEVCWTTSALVQNCESVDLNDSSASTPVIFTNPGPGNYSVSITNKASGVPLVIDAIQVLEDGVMAEGIYQDDSTDFIFSDVYTPLANTNASDGSVMELDNGESVTFTFDGIAFSALVVENSPTFHVCAYAGAESDGNCAADDVLDDTVTSTTSTVSAASYSGFHNNDGSDNAKWTVVITNQDVTPLLIDRVDILGNRNELEITDNDVHEAGEPQIRYLPFSSWTEQTTFKNGTPLNGDRFETVIPGSIAYFEFNDDFGSGSVGIEYVRQIRDQFIPAAVCTKYKKGKCKSYYTPPPVSALAGAEVCYGEVGDPTSITNCLNVLEVSNGTIPATPADAVDVYEFGTSTEPVDPSCVNGCWATIEYDRDAEVSFTPLDYIRLYDPEATLKAGVYQESHPNIKASVGSATITDTNAKVAFYNAISGTGESYFSFAFEGTGFSARTFEGSTADDISLCVYEYSGAKPDVNTAFAGATCLRTYDNVQTTDGFTTRALHGLHHDANYMAFVTMDSDGSTVLGLDQITIYNKQWFDESNLSDATYLKQLMGGNSYPVNSQTSDSDKLAQFIGDWDSLDRGVGSGTSVIYRSSGANSTSIDIELGELGSFQICAIPMTSSGAPFGVDIGAEATCQTITQSGRTNASFLFSDDLSDHVITVELLSDTWMNVYNIDLYDILNGLSEGLYDQSAPGIQYDSTYNAFIEEDMEESDIDWTTVGTPLINERSTSTTVCVKYKKGKCKSYSTVSEPRYEGSYSRKLIANIGQGIQYVGSGSGVSLDTDTHYTAIARVYVDPTTSGSIMMNIVSGTETLNEIVGLDLSTKTTGSWQTIRADFYTEQAYDEVFLQLVAINGKATAYIDDITLTTGGQWENATPTIDTYGGNYTISETPGASITFDFVGNGFELGLLASAQGGEVDVCYYPESAPSNVNCFTYSQDDVTVVSTVVCTKTKKGTCKRYSTITTYSSSITGRSVVGLPNDTWTVTVRDSDDGYTLANPTTTRNSTTLGLDYLWVFDDTDIVTVPPGSYNEDAQDNSDTDYLTLYPETEWKAFSGTNAFTNKTYVAPTIDSIASTVPGPTALLQINVGADDEGTAIILQLGGSSSGLVQNLMVCVDETNGKMEWDGTKFELVDSDNCILVDSVDTTGQISVTNDDIAALDILGVHNVTVTSLTKGLFRVDSYQVFKDRALGAGLHNESLPSTILNFEPSDLNPLTTCDLLNEWCTKKNKTISTTGCVKYKKGKCKAYGTISSTSSPYIGSAAVTSKSGATANFVARGTGFSIISDVSVNGLDFRVCYKLESSGTAFPAITSSDETDSLNGFEDATGLPILISEGGILCENLTTDTANWDEVMDRPASSGGQYGFSFYGLPLSTYEIQVMVTTPQSEIVGNKWFALDAITVFSDISSLSALQPGLTDDASANISYEPSQLWESNSTSSTYELTDSTTNHAGAISQFKVEGNTLVVYQTMGSRSSNVQICLLISNENIHCSVEAERQSRLARQVTSYSQQGGTTTKTVCVKFKKKKCKSYSTVTTKLTTVFTPMVFYGLGEDTTHTVIMENQAHNQTFNLDAFRVLE